MIRMIYKYFKDEYVSLKFRLRKVVDEIKNNDLMSEKCKKTYKYLNYGEHLLVLVSAITGCVSIPPLASLFCVPVGITSSAVAIKT